MKDIEREADDILEQARRGFSPGPGAADRVLAKLGPLMAQAGPADLSPEQELGSRSPAVASALGHAPTWLSRVLVTALIAAGFGAGGYWLGFRGGLRQAQSTRTPATPALVASAATPALSASQAQTEVKAEPATVEPPNQPIKERVARASVTTSTRLANPNLGEPRDTLQEEVETLRRVERAHRLHNPRLALSLLSELDLLVPRGKLMEERFATGTIARCELALASKDELLAAFVKRYARSAYADRVARACSKTEAP